MSIQLNKLTGLVLLCLAFFSSGLVAQDFSAQNSKYSPAIYGDKFTYEEDKFYYFNELAGVLFLKGSIEKGMYKDFRQAIADNNIHTLVLESPGGIVLEGVLIAETVFDRKIKTYIRKNQYCASACSFIFLSGKTRYSLGKLGVHQIGYSDEFSKTKDEVGKIAEAVQTVNSRIIQVLDENDTPGFVYKYMLRGEEMYYFNEDELNQLGNSDVSPQDKLLFNRIDNFSKDYNSHLIKQKCDTDPNSCTTAQLCSRAAKGNMWRTSLDAAKFVKLAKSKGNRCGVPVPICPEDIKKCNQEYLCTYGTTGLDASLSWLNNSFADEAKLRGYSCGVVSKPVVKTETKKPKCDTDINSCTTSQLCSRAAKAKESGILYDAARFGKLAKSRGYSCEVKKQITFPDGFTSYQIVERLKSNLELKGEVGPLPAEGSLAPDTYSYQDGDSRRGILKKMSDMQNEILEEFWKLRSKDLPFKNKKEALIIASIIEKETLQIKEMKLVSSVIMNRLKSGIPLGMDSTIVYELTNGNPKNMRSIKQSDLEKDTKYNTRKFQGLPPSAIGNPGMPAIEAALNPEKTDFLYFVTDGSGGHFFAKTLFEHTKNVQKWHKIKQSK